MILFAHLPNLWFSCMLRIVLADSSLMPTLTWIGKDTFINCYKQVHSTMKVE